MLPSCLIISEAVEPLEKTAFNKIGFSGMSNHNVKYEFSPVFIVGAPRSGTTLVAVLLNRHSRIAIPPETQFFTEFSHEYQSLSNPAGEAQKLVELALAHHRISDLNLEPKEVLAELSGEDRPSLPHLFAAVLTAYAKKQNKPRPGEKSPKHLEHVSELQQNFPKGKILCVLRDGRDVVRSLLKTDWAEPGNRRRFGLFCMEWSYLAKLIFSFEKNLPEESFMVVKYEDLLTEPEESLRKICSFLEEDFEKQMMQASGESGVVPEWEGKWKQKAEKMLDPSRAYAWKKQADSRQIWKMNVMMGPELQMAGYEGTELDACPLYLRLAYGIGKIPYLPAMQPISLMGLKIVRRVKGLFGN